MWCFQSYVTKRSYRGATVLSELFIIFLFLLLRPTTDLRQEEDIQPRNHDLKKLPSTLLPRTNSHRRLAHYQ